MKICLISFLWQGFSKDPEVQTLFRCLAQVSLQGHTKKEKYNQGFQLVKKNKEEGKCLGFSILKMKCSIWNLHL